MFKLYLWTHKPSNVSSESLHSIFLGGSFNCINFTIEQSPNEKLVLRDQQNKVVKDLFHCCLSIDLNKDCWLNDYVMVPNHVEINFYYQAVQNVGWDIALTQ